MKKYILLIFLSFSILASCTKSTGSESSIPDTGIDEPSNSSLFLQNNSLFKVKIFSDSLRENELFVLNPEESKEISGEYVGENTNLTFYITYIVDVGFEIPWYSNDSFLIADLQEGKSGTAIIHTPKSMPVNNCYVVLENNTNENVIFKQGAAELYLNNEKNTTILRSGEKAAYEIKSIYFENLPSYRIITTKGEEILLPQELVKFESENIYSILISDLNQKIKSNLKSVTPFNIDTARQIWKFSDDTFFPESAVVKSAYNPSETDGFLIMGTMQQNQVEIGLKKIDYYNSVNILNTVKFTHKASVIVNKSRVIDFAEMKDGSVAILLENEYTEDNENGSVQFLVCYDFSSKTLKWSYIFPDRMIFRTDSKNIMICTAEDKLAVAGATVKKDVNDVFWMQRYFAVFNDDGTVNIFTSDDSTNLSKGIETIFSSVCFDGKDFIVCGYDNCDFMYSDRIHKGIIWKFSSDLSKKEEIYECNRVLFFCLDGAAGNWYACGEFCDAGKILKGCCISSELLGDSFVEYSVKNYPYCSFTQMFSYEDKIILAGSASKDLAGKDSPMPFIIMYDIKSNILMWENTNLKNYTGIRGIIPNAIGTYIVQLSSDSYLHYFSADLSGREK